MFRRLGVTPPPPAPPSAIEANPAAYGTNFCTTIEEAERFVARVDQPQVA